jgi:hypothetical protein
MYKKLMCIVALVNERVEFMGKVLPLSLINRQWI